VNDQIAICSAANHAYVMGLAVALVSALRHAPASERRVKIYVLDGGIRDGDWNRLARSLKSVGRSHELIRLRPDMARFSGLPQDWGSSVMTYARLALPEMVTDSGKIFYIDSDLVVQQNWAPVWNVSLDGAVIAASVDVVTKTIGAERLPVEECGLNGDAPYFQAGMMVIDLPRWREEKVSERVLTYLKSHSDHARHWDQSALNVVLYQKWQQLPDHWNTPAWWADSGREGCVLDAPLLHFVGPHKPWLYGYQHSGSAHLFFEELDQTAWATWRPSALRQLLRILKYKLYNLIRRH
jgi:lipopolysaccharide biosynthesis glycosyltransferase